MLLHKSCHKPQTYQNWVRKEITRATWHRISFSRKHLGVDEIDCFEELRRFSSCVCCLLYIKSFYHKIIWNLIIKPVWYVTQLSKPRPGLNRGLTGVIADLLITSLTLCNPIFQTYRNNSKPTVFTYNRIVRYRCDVCFTAAYRPDI